MKDQPKTYRMLLKRALDVAHVLLELLHCILRSGIKMNLLNPFTGLGWSQPCDVWSTGCILTEYYVGNTLFLVGNYEPQSDAACVMLLSWVKIYYREVGTAGNGFRNETAFLCYTKQKRTEAVGAKELLGRRLLQAA